MVSRLFPLAALSLLLLAFLPGRAWAPAAVESAAIMAHSGLFTGSAKATGAGLAERFVRVAEPLSGGKTVSGRGAPTSTAKPLKKRVPSKTPGTAHGAVHDASGRAIPGLTVAMRSIDPNYEVVYREVVTDSAGGFVFTGLDPGPWRVDLDPRRLPARYAAPRLTAPIQVARSQRIHLPPIRLEPGACAHGFAKWSDGYPMADAQLLVAPRDTTSYAVGGTVSGDGRFNLCGVPADRVMIWLDLGDGRHLGSPAPLATGDSATVRFAPEPANDVPGTQLAVSVRTADGRAIAFAEVLVGGRRAATAREPALVYLRQAATDRDGIAEFTLPYGSYRILAMNPREGEWRRVDDLVVGPGAPRLLTKDLLLSGVSTPAERKAWTAEFYAQAESAIFLWEIAGLAPVR